MLSELKSTESSSWPDAKSVMIGRQFSVSALLGPLTSVRVFPSAVFPGQTPGKPEWCFPGPAS